jgi:hypothetical protein
MHDDINYKENGRNAQKKSKFQYEESFNLEFGFIYFGFLF